MLNLDKALELARRLTVLADFPTYAEAIEATAEDLVYLTDNAPDPDVAEARARWLVNEIRRTWPRWSGTADLITLYRKRFSPPREIQSEDNEAKNFGPKSPIACTLCNDTGVFRPGGRESKEPYQWCECDAGITLHFDLPDWLSIVNGRAPVLVPVATSKRIALDPIHPATEKELEKQAECPACTAERRHTHSEYWEHHNRQEIA